jgi:hypothetical protein
MEHVHARKPEPEGRKGVVGTNGTAQADAWTWPRADCSAYCPGKAGAQHETAAATATARVRDGVIVSEIEMRSQQ